MNATAADYPIQPVPFTQVKIQDRFFKPRLNTNRDITVSYVFLRCQQTGRLDNFAKAGGLIPGEFEGIYFNDSDVFKAIEGASYSLATGKRTLLNVAIKNAELVLKEFGPKENRLIDSDLLVRRYGQRSMSGT